MTRADQEIELRIKTLFSTTAALETYAQDIARAADRVLISVRKSDWHKPYVVPACPYKFRTRKWMAWTLDCIRQQLRNPRIRIVDNTLRRAIYMADERLGSARSKDYQKSSPDDLEPYFDLVSPAKAIWVAREIAGVSEVTLLPASSGDSAAYPIIATFATRQAMEIINRAVDLLGDGETPIKAAREIIWGSDTSDILQAHNNQRIAMYRALWAEFCAQRGYDQIAPMRPCVCPDCPRPTHNLALAADQYVYSLYHPKQHLAECYEREIDILTFWSDWPLAESLFIREVGERHSRIAYNRRKAAKARQVAKVKEVS
ncbi:MAG: hypothetical protein EOP06_29315 [Proteobacteria bacterium]|nr:MAG: hypothetical protein EOP06_29315 [Pseudomonadota bacterium]